MSKQRVIGYRLKLVNLNSKKVIGQRDFQSNSEMNAWINDNLKKLSNKGFNIEEVRSDYYH